MISRRRSVAALYRNFHVPPNIAPGSYGADGLPLRGAGPARNGGPQDIEAAARNGKAVYHGVGCSAGQAAGPCRVALGIEEAAGLRVGEILVAPHANPAWTPLFHLAAGLVLEEGGLLSHSAVVAREYGVPAVLQVKGATRLFRTGDILVIDGAAGTVAAEPKR
jgi:pyruvate,water dikinase